MSKVGQLQSTCILSPFTPLTMPRSSGRVATELRPLSISIGELSRADGSGSFAFGSERALASFQGPAEVKLRDERVDQATLEVVHRPVDRLGATSSKSLIETIEAIQSPLLHLSSHPRSLIQIVIQSLTPSPPSGVLSFSARTSAINAATLASLDAGSIALRNVAVAVSVAFDAQGDLQLDPDAEEEGLASSLHAVAWAGEEAVWIESEGDFSREQFAQAMEQSRLACQTILETIRKQLEEIVSIRAAKQHVL